MFGNGLGNAIMGAFIIGCAASAVLGWAVIELIIWIASHITISWQ